MAYASVVLREMVCVTVPEFSPCEHGLRGMVGLGSITPPEPTDALMCLLSMLHWDRLFAIFGSEHGEIYGAAV